MITDITIKFTLWHSPALETLRPYGLLLRILYPFFWLRISSLNYSSGEHCFVRFQVLSAGVFSDRTNPVLSIRPLTSEGPRCRREGSRGPSPAAGLLPERPISRMPLYTGLNPHRILNHKILIRISTLLANGLPEGGGVLSLDVRLELSDGRGGGQQQPFRPQMISGTSDDYLWQSMPPRHPKISSEMGVVLLVRSAIFDHFCG